MVESGGKVYARRGFIGDSGTADYNSVIVNGTDSELVIAQGLLIGASTNVGNKVTITRAGKLSAASIFVSSNNHLGLDFDGVIDVGGDFSVDPNGSFKFLDGTLVVAGTVSNLVDVPLTGRLETSTVIGDLQLNGTWEVGPASTTSALLEGDLACGSSAVVQMEIGGQDAGVTHDQLTVTGSTALGGVLEVAFSSGFSATNWSAFQIFNWGQAPTEKLDSLKLPIPAKTQRWDSSRLYDLGILRLMPADSDSDGDGIDDRWEMDYFGANAGAAEDADMDLMSNLDEFIAGTDPTNSMDVLTVTLDASWNTIQSNLIYPTNVCTNQLHSVESAGFYRLHVELP